MTPLWQNNVQSLKKHLLLGADMQTELVLLYLLQLDLFDDMQIFKKSVYMYQNLEKQSLSQSQQKDFELLRKKELLLP